jgi:hypothetical protein
VPFRLERIPDADDEFLALPPAVRETMISAFPEWGRAGNPVLSGDVRHVEVLRQRRRASPAGIFSLHVGPADRAIFGRRGSTLTFIAFGAHIPEDDVYRKLDRVRVRLSH